MGKKEELENKKSTKKVVKKTLQTNLNDIDLFDEFEQTIKFDKPKELIIRIESIEEIETDYGVAEIVKGMGLTREEQKENKQMHKINFLLVHKSLKTQFEKLDCKANDLVYIKYIGIAIFNQYEFKSFYVAKK